MPSRVVSATSFIALIQVAMRAPVGSSRMMKCRMCLEVIISLVPSKGIISLVCGSSLIGDRKSTRLNSSHVASSYAVFCLKKKTTSAAFRPSVTSGDRDYRNRSKLAGGGTAGHWTLGSHDQGGHDVDPR